MRWTGSCRLRRRIKTLPVVKERGDQLEMTIRALYTATSGMQVQEQNLDTIANNLANANTTAFKRTRVNFEDLFYQYQKLPGTVDSSGQPTPIGLEFGLGARVAGTEVDQTQGTFTQTGANSTWRFRARAFSRCRIRSQERRSTRVREHFR